MNVGLLLEWMTHVGSGSWSAFRGAVDELASDDEKLDEQALYRQLRVLLSDLGHVDFFVGGSRRWRVLRPALAGIGVDGDYLLIGGRNRALVEELATAATGPELSFTHREGDRGLSQMCLHGPEALVREVAIATGLDVLPNAAIAIASCVPLLHCTLESAATVPEPINWEVRSWSFGETRWVSGKLTDTLREYSNRHGATRYLHAIGGRELREIEKRAGIYCAALLRRARIVRYSAPERLLHVPLWAPLPAMHARAACLASGRLAIVNDGDFVFEQMEPRVASMLMVSLGQGCPLLEVPR